MSVHSTDLMGAITEVSGSGCVYPCLWGKRAMAAFFVAPFKYRIYDGISAFRATYGSEEDAAAAADDARRRFPYVRQPSPLVVVAHFEPGAASGFHVHDPRTRPSFVALAAESTALLAVCDNGAARDHLMHEAEEADGTEGSTLIAGMHEVESVKEIMQVHSDGGYLFKVGNPVALQLYGRERLTLDGDDVEFLKDVGVTHIPLAICRRMVQ